MPRRARSPWRANYSLVFTEKCSLTTCVKSTRIKESKATQLYFSRVGCWQQGHNFSPLPLALLILSPSLCVCLFYNTPQLTRGASVRGGWKGPALSHYARRRFEQCSALWFPPDVIVSRCRWSIWCLHSLRRRRLWTAARQGVSVDRWWKPNLIRERFMPPCISLYVASPSDIAGSLTVLACLDHNWIKRQQSNKEVERVDMAQANRLIMGGWCKGSNIAALIGDKCGGLQVFLG